MIHELTLLLMQLRNIMKNLSDEDRLELMYRFSDGYCRWCGREDPSCQCMNDE